MDNKPNDKFIPELINYLQGKMTNEHGMMIKAISENLKDVSFMHSVKYQVFGEVYDSVSKMLKRNFPPKSQGQTKSNIIKP